ncbi:BZ3500_MvSof-1268-A1-R1_Chr2-1g04149 [Microbotryum saponariae]|uniref:BZ3500_MvSof-1268-A1-R1_Chr2-1g04149 protein n=1 Tax=Microbotryum saponariae TaxID=289078 RepID=A0A2X0KPL3_9BASI|nr:BZ3500_MvSof-1268-A1-R1_Chr2-1g04149 [Microbotryum saponariae]SCZ91136.1 BZ3501_MvSof-1269-A2-R1_Chr2-1g03805 [Microbotryum saponariae]
MSDLFVSALGVRKITDPRQRHTVHKICCADDKVRLPGIEKPAPLPELLALLTGDGPALLFLVPTKRIEARRGFNGPPEKVRRLDTAYQQIVPAYRHWASLHVVPRPSATFYEPEAPTQPSYNIADGKRTALSVDDVDRLAAMYAKQRTTVSSLKADGHDIVKLPEV